MTVRCLHALIIGQLLGWEAVATEPESELLFSLQTHPVICETRNLEAVLSKKGEAPKLRLIADKSFGQQTAWASLGPPGERWNFEQRENLEATVKNTSTAKVTVTLWVVSSHGWDAVGDEATLEPREEQQLSCDLREAYPDGTPKIDPTSIREIRIMLQRTAPGASVEVTTLKATRKIETWIRPGGRLDVPEMEHGRPAPGRRVRYQLPSDRGTRIYSALYLPPEWQAGKRYPIIAEYPGNAFYSAKRCWSTGRPEQCVMGYGITSGKGAIWISLPFVDRKSGRIAENGFGSKDGNDTCAHALAAMQDLCANWGGDPERLFLSGFSRGAIACGYIGLANEELASMWKGIIACQHYDGSAWNQSNMGGALQRAPRFKGSAIFQIDNDRSKYAPLEERSDPHIEWTWRKSGLNYHATAMFLDDRPLMQELRLWFTRHSSPD
ncbi:MAG: hypothetical protein AAGI48_10765 [Verrucomicrobiota bacterium]